MTLEKCADKIRINGEQGVRGFKSTEVVMKTRNHVIMGLLEMKMRQGKPYFLTSDL